MMWVYVVLSVVILIAIFYLFRKDKDILSGTDPTVSLQKVEITIERQDNDDNIENYTLNEDVDMRINLSWTNGLGWDDRFNIIHMKLYFGDVVVAERLIAKNSDAESDKYFMKFEKLSMSFATGKEIGGATPFSNLITLDGNIIGKSLYFSMTVTDTTNNQIEVFKESDDTNGKRMLIDQSSVPPKPVRITEEQIKRVVEISGLETLVFPLNISELTSSVTFGKVDYLEIYVNEQNKFFIKPTANPGEFLYYKDDLGRMYYVPGRLKFYAPVISMLPNHAAISYTSIINKKEYLLYGDRFIPEDEFKSITHTSSSDRAPDYLINIVKSDKMSELLTEANFNYVNNLIRSIKNYELSDADRKTQVKSETLDVILQQNPETTLEVAEKTSEVIAAAIVGSEEWLKENFASGKFKSGWTLNNMYEYGKSGESKGNNISDCRKQAIAIDAVGVGFRNDKVPDDNYKNTCFFYSQTSNDNWQEDTNLISACTHPLKKWPDCS